MRRTYFHLRYTGSRRCEQAPHQGRRRFGRWISQDNADGERHRLREGKIREVLERRTNSQTSERRMPKHPPLTFASHRGQVTRLGKLASSFAFASSMPPETFTPAPVNKV
jgi:hypothetical protein